MKIPMNFLQTEVLRLHVKWRSEIPVTYWNMCEAINSSSTSSILSIAASFRPMRISFPFLTLPVSFAYDALFAYIWAKEKGDSCAGEKKGGKARYADRRLLMKRNEGPFSRKLHLSPLSPYFFFYFFFFLPFLFQFCSCPLGHTLENACKGPINVKYQAAKQGESREKKRKITGKRADATQAKWGVKKETKQKEKLIDENSKGDCYTSPIYSLQQSGSVLLRCCCCCGGDGWLLQQSNIDWLWSKATPFFTPYGGQLIPSRWDDRTLPFIHAWARAHTFNMHSEDATKYSYAFSYL